MQTNILGLHEQFKMTFGVCVCGRITDLSTPPSFCDMRQCILLLIRCNLVFHLINIEFVFSCLIIWSQGKVFQIWDKKCL